MSHEPGAPETRTTAEPRSYRGAFASLKNGARQVVGISKVASRLGPKQVKDELKIATMEMKEKGAKLGVGAAFVAVGLVFALFAVIVLLVAAVAGLAKVMEAWLAALLLGVLFIILLAIFALIGVSKIKKQLPLKPESAIFGLLYDLGVAKEGSAYTSSRVRRELREKQEEKEAEKKEKKRREDAGEVPAEATPTRDQVEQRTKARRDHLKTLRDDFSSQTDRVKSTARGLVGKTTADAKAAPNRARDVAEGLADNAMDPEAAKQRWAPLSALAVSLGAFVLFLGRLLKRR